MIGLGLQIFRRAIVVAGSLPALLWNTTASKWELTYNNWNE